MSKYNKDLILALHPDEEAMDTVRFAKDRIIIDDVLEEETDQLHGVSLSDHDLLHLSYLVVVTNQPLADMFIFIPGTRWSKRKIETGNPRALVQITGP